jgi:hypothetical protein
VLTSRAEQDSRLQPLGGLTVISPAESLRAHCKRMLDAELVVAVTSPELPADELLTCVARGANVVAMAPEEPRELAALPAGRPVYWGAGAISVVKTTEAAASEAALLYTQRYEWRSTVHDSLLTWSRGEEAVPPRPAEPQPVPGSRVVLLVIGVYVGLIVVAGRWVARRPRPAWLGWGWFPALALGTAVVLGLISRGWGESPTEAVETEVRVVAPTQAGLGLHSFCIQTAGADVLAFDLPWTDDSVLKQLDRSHRFGNPFARSLDDLLLREDRIAQRLSVENLAMNRRDSAGMVWREPLAAGPAPVTRIERRVGGELWATHTSGKPLGRAVLCTRTSELTLDHWAVGQAVHLEGEPGQQRQDDRDSVFRTVRTMLCDRQPVDSVVIAVELPADPTGPTATVRPAILVRRRAIEINIGPALAEGPVPMARPGGGP